MGANPVGGAAWTSEFTLRGRWNSGGLVNDTSLYAQVHNTGETDTTVRGSTWTASSTPLTELKIGRAANPIDGFIAKFEIASRERPL